MKKFLSVLLISFLFLSCTIKPTEECEDCKSSSLAYEYSINMTQFKVDYINKQFVVKLSEISSRQPDIRPGDLIAVYFNKFPSEKWLAMPQTELSPYSQTLTNEIGFSILESYTPDGVDSKYSETSFKDLAIYIKPDASAFNGANYPYPRSQNFVFRVVVAKTNDQIITGYQPDFFKF